MLTQINRQQLTAAPQFDMALIDEGTAFFLAVIDHQAEPEPLTPNTPMEWGSTPYMYGFTHPDGTQLTVPGLRDQALAEATGDFQHTITCQGGETCTRA